MPLLTLSARALTAEIARQLIEVDVSVIIGARDAGRASEAVAELASAALQVRSVGWVLNDPASVAAAAEAIRTKYGRLDILVNNAGIADAQDGPPTIASPEAAHRITDTSFVSTLVVTQAFLPLLRQSQAARIVNLSSLLGSLGLNGDPTPPNYSVRLIGYNASKAALNMLTVQLAVALRDMPHVINSAARAM